MAKYTMELRRVAQFYSEEEVKLWFMDYMLEDYLTQDEIDVIENRGIWSKEKLANKIYNHYLMREIGFETPALFKHYVKTTMQEIMESKLPLIYSASIEYNPLVNVDYTETYEREIGGTNTSLETGQNVNTNSASGLTINSVPSQGEINKNELLSGKYATNTSAGESSNTENNNSTINRNDSNSSEESYTKNIKGNSGVSATAQKMIQQYRENIIAIDKSIIEELNILFMQIY